MYIKNRMIALAFRCVLLTGCAIGLFVNLGLIDGRFNLSSLIYYTNLSNLVCFLYFIPLAAYTTSQITKNGLKGSTVLLPHVKGAFTMMITITLLIYHILLSDGKLPVYNGTDFMNWLSNILLHYITPIMVILDWVLFDPKRSYRWYDPLLWLAIPYLYVLYAMLRAEIAGAIPGRGSRYPYFFMDLDVLGWGGVLQYIAIITLAFVVLGYVMLLIDRLLSISRKKTLTVELPFSDDKTA